MFVLRQIPARIWKLTIEIYGFFLIVVICLKLENIMGQIKDSVDTILPDPQTRF
jgi:hypothetical protein